MKFVYIFLLSSIIIACKKKESPAPTQVNNPSVITNYTYGSMATIYYLYYNGNTFLGTDSVVSSFFFTDPLNPGSTVVNAGTISYNGFALINNTANNYTSYTSNIHQSNSVWAVSGSADVPVINYTLTPNYPVFTGNTQLPDSFSISSGLNFTLAGISNHPNASTYIQLNDFTNSVYKNLAVNQTNCSFSAAELSVFVPGSYLSITIILRNIVVQDFNGKSYGFSSSINHVKSGILVRP